MNVEPLESRSDTLVVEEPNAIPDETEIKQCSVFKRFHLNLCS